MSSAVSSKQIGLIVAGAAAAGVVGWLLWKHFTPGNVRNAQPLHPLTERQGTRMTPMPMPMLIVMCLRWRRCRCRCRCWWWCIEQSDGAKKRGGCKGARVRRSEGGAADVASEKFGHLPFGQKQLSKFNRIFKKAYTRAYTYTVAVGSALCADLLPCDCPVLCAVCCDVSCLVGYE
jgi:hypothetical protein